MRPTRFDLVCVRINGEILDGDIYVGERVKAERDEYVLKKLQWTPPRHLGKVRETVRNIDWEHLGPGGYWVWRPVFEEENEFGPVSP